ncbi:MAG: hypothetical protein ACJ8AQ_14115 [Gemmatimonadales bacterium]
MRSNLNFRPPSYWEHLDPVSAILSNIKGQNRRQMIAAVITGRAPAHVGEIPSGFLEAKLDDSTRAELGATHPSWLGGEYLPDYLPGEVEIARIVLDSVTQDVISFRARRRRHGRRILYRVVDEYCDNEIGPWICRPASSAQPLTLAGMIQLIDTARSADFAEQEGSLPDLLRGIQEGCEPEELGEFVAVESDFYPQLSGYYRRQARCWLEQHRNGRG